MILCRALSYEENTLDKSLLRKSIWKTTPAKVVSTTSSILQMMDTVEQTLLMCDKEVIEV